MRKVDIQFLQDMYKEAMSCPRAAGDVDLNTKNRDKTIEKHNYGPLNLSDEGYWELIADKWNTTEDVARKSRCGNCVAFDVSPRMDKCMPGPVSDGEGRLGYCWMHHFKCHSARTCNTWAKGGPIKEDEASHDWQKKAKGVEKEASVIANTAVQAADPYLPNTGREGAAAGALGGLLAGGLFSVPMSYAARRYGVPLSPYAAPAVGAVAGGIGGKILGDKRSQVKTASSEYDDSHMLSKILMRMSAQSAHLKDKIDAGLVIPSWAEYKLYNAYSNLGSALGTAYPGEYEKDASKPNFDYLLDDPKTTEDLAEVGDLSKEEMRAWKKLKGKSHRFSHSKEAATATKTNPQLWEKSKQQAKARMGGKHSARAMQLATKIYKSKGGGYSGSKPSSKNNSLKKWGKQKWGYSGKDKPGQGGSGVYLPEAKRKRLKSTKQGRKQLAAATRKKHKATAQGKQYSSHGLAAGTSLKKTAEDYRHHIDPKEVNKYKNIAHLTGMLSDLPMAYMDTGGFTTGLGLDLLSDVAKRRVIHDAGKGKSKHKQKALREMKFADDMATLTGAGSGVLNLLYSRKTGKRNPTANYLSMVLPEIAVREYGMHKLKKKSKMKKEATLIPTYFEYRKARKKRREKKARKMLSMGKYASSSRVKSPNSYYNPIRFTAPAPPLETMSTGNEGEVLNQSAQAAIASKNRSDAASVAPPLPPQPLKPATALVEPPFRPRYTGM